MRLLFSCAAIVAIAVQSANGVTIATVPVGYPGNAPDTAVMTDGTTGYGAVPYNYRIGTYDVTNAQYVEFLNAKASAADPYGLWNSNMDVSQFEGAIARLGSGPYVYTVRPGYANKPVVHVTWFDAVRFANWLQNGQGNGDTESGTYTITNGGNNSGTASVPDAIQRANWSSAAPLHWLLPSENEWYKAAYFNGPTGTYYGYPFQSNAQPAAVAPPGNANSGDFALSSADFPAYNYDGSLSHMTDVGAYPNSRSPFGAFDMGGNAYQWNDAIIGPYVGLRGGYWRDGPSTEPAASFRYIGVIPSAEGYNGGLRVASIGGVPEPSTIILASFGLVGLLIFSMRLRARRVASTGLSRVNGR